MPLSEKINLLLIYLLIDGLTYVYLRTPASLPFISTFVFMLAEHHFGCYSFMITLEIKKHDHSSFTLFKIILAILAFPQKFWKHLVVSAE